MDENVTNACVFGRLPRAGMGDLVQRNIFFGLLRRAFPDARLTWVVGTQVARVPFQDELVRRHSYADEIMVCPDDQEGRARFVDRLRDRRFEVCVVDPGSEGLGVHEAWQADIGIRVAVQPGEPTTHPMRLGCRPDLYDFTVALAGALGTPAPAPERAVPRLPFRPEEPPRWAARRPIVGVHPGGVKRRNRRWPPARFAELSARLVDELDATLLLLGSADEADEIGWLCDAVLDGRPGAGVHTSVGEPLNRVANLVDGLDLLVGNDSGPAHLAAALTTPTVVIYGPTGTEAMCSRVYPVHRGVSRNYPCQLLGYLPADSTRQCANNCQYPYESAHGPYPKCLTDVTVAEVWDAVLSQLSIATSAVKVSAG